MRPGRGAVFCDGDVVDAEEDGGDAVDVEELGGERGGVWRREGGARGEVLEGARGDGVGEDALVGVELEGLARVSGVVGREACREDARLGWA
jgi:hypothetical protein